MMGAHVDLKNNNNEQLAEYWIGLLFAFIYLYGN